MDCIIPGPERQAQTSVLCHTASPAQPGNPAVVPPAVPHDNDHQARLAFSRPCPSCRATVSLPWCPILTAVLDRIDALETGYREDLPGEMAVLHARLLWLEAALRDLQAHDAEVQP